MVMDALEKFNSPSVETIGEFMSTLEQSRIEAKFDEWCEFTKKSPLLRKWRYFLAQDPYTRWGLVKPRGYAGDATLMDFAYGHPTIQEEVDNSGGLAQAIYRHTSGAPQSASARLRIDLIAEEINKAAMAGPVTLVSYASGHARELERLPSQTKANVNVFIAIDADANSLREASRSAANMPFIAQRRNVIKQDMSDLAKGDLVYSLGLFDYLNDEHAVMVCKKMLEQTKPGGTLLLANLAPTAGNLAYCEAIMDWWMITRDDSQLATLAKHALKDVAGEANVERHGCFNYLRICLAE
jgi:hypothetical protein